MAPAMLTEEQRTAFERDGFLVVPGALPPEMVERLLGDAQTQLGYYLPQDEDVPLRAWHRAREAEPAA